MQALIDILLKKENMMNDESLHNVYSFLFIK